MDSKNDDNEDRCSCCGGEFVYGVSYQCFVCSNRICIKHFEHRGGLDFCYGCSLKDFVYTEMPENSNVNFN